VAIGARRKPGIGRQARRPTNSVSLRRNGRRARIEDDDMSWTPERIEKLQKLWEQGLSASQIADDLGEGVSRNAVIGKAHRLGLKVRPSPVKTEAAPKKAPAAPTAAPTPRKPKAPPAKSARVTLLDLNDRVCKWPHGHPSDDDFHFCGKPVQPGFPYCGEHCAVAYQAQLPRRDRRGNMPPVRGPGA